jgi:tetratricopeptide (TPR) repeat protein
MQPPDVSKTAQGQSGTATPLEMVGLALSARQQGDLSGALRLLEGASNAAPENLNILVELANTLRALSRLGEAEAIYARVLDRSPGHFGALVGLGHVAKQRADRPGALIHFEAAAKANPGHLNLQVEIANTLREMSRLDEAEVVYHRIVEQEPGHVGALVGLGQICRERVQWQAALAYCQAAAAARPGDLNVQLEIAYTFRAMERFDEAEVVYRRIVEREPGHVGALVGLGHIAREREQWRVALEHFQAAAAMRPGDLNIQLEIAHMLRTMERFDEAEVVYRRIVEREPGHVGALVGLGYIAREREQWPVALEHLQAAAVVRPGDLNIQLEISHTLRAMERFDEAEVVFRRIVEQEPGQVGARLGLGYIAREREQWPLALEHFQAAAAVRPGDLNIQLEIAHTLRAMERFDEAEVVFRRIVEQEPGQVGARLGLGYIAREREQWPLASEHFQAAAAVRPGDLKIQLEIAHMLRAMERFDEAEIVYRRIVEQEPGQVGARLGLGYIAREREQWPLALEHLQVAAVVRPGDLNIQLEIARTLRRMLRLDDAEATCQRILNQVPNHVGALVTLGSIARQRLDHAAALGYFRAVTAIDQSKLDVQVEIGHTLREMDRTGEAEAIFRSILEYQPDHVPAILGLGFVARQGAEWPAALAHFEAAAAARPHDLSIQLEVARALCDLKRFEEAEAGYLRVLQQSPGHGGARLGLGFVARQRTDWPAALAHFEAAAAANPDQLRPQLEIASTLREMLRVDEAEAIFRRLEESPDSKTDPEFKAKRLEHFCTTLQLEKASECLASWGGHRNVPSGGVALAAGLYATRGQWLEVLDLFRERVVESAEKPSVGELLLEALSRATRATGRYEEVLTLLDRLLDGKSNPAVLNLRDQIIEEARLLHSVDRLNSDGALVQGLTIGTPFRAWRADLVSRLLHPVSQAKPDKTIYLCTDRNYLPGAVVGVSSLLRNNMEALRNYSLVVFCSDEILDFASVTFRELAAAFSVHIDLRASSSLFPAGSGFRTGWGMFTPGHGLSEAAYYRIYAALQLLEEGVVGRALYVDSDTCVGPHLDQLLDFDLEGQPLGARPEISTLVEIRRAALRLGIRPGAYFNSGVLLFDLSHPRLSAALRQAIDISLTQKHMLTFVDQCALNLAFRDMYATLPEPFNLFVRQETEANSVSSNPVVRHFLQRPKPWDPMYWSVNSTPWFEEFAALAHVMDPSRLKRLLALQFPDESSRTGHRSIG